MTDIYNNGKTSLASTSNYTSYDARFNLDIPEVRTAHNGNQPIRIYQMSMYLRGRLAPRSVSMILEFSDGTGRFSTTTFTADTGSSATNTGFKTINAWYSDTPKNNLQAGFDTNGDTFFGAATDATTDIYRDSDPTKSILVDHCLFGQLRYHEVPTAPTGLSASTATNEGFTVGWTAPSDNGGTVINGYRIQVSTVSNFASNVTTFDVGVVSSAVLTDLLPDTSYYYRVGAKNWLFDNVAGAPHSPWVSSVGTITTLSTTGGKRYTGSAWVDNTVAKRYNGSSWVDLTTKKRYNGSAWVDLT